MAQVTFPVFEIYMNGTCTYFEFTLMVLAYMYVTLFLTFFFPVNIFSDPFLLLRVHITRCF